MNRAGQKKLGKRQEHIMLEAARRWLQACSVLIGGPPPDHPQYAKYIKDQHRRGITGAWTGLGSRTAYKTVVNAGLMESVGRCEPGVINWWRLTDKGSEVVLSWIDAGLRLGHFDGSKYASATIESLLETWNERWGNDNGQE